MHVPGNVGTLAPPMPPLPSDTPVARTSPVSASNRSSTVASKASTLGLAPGSAARHWASRAFTASRRPALPGLPSTRTRHGMGSPSSSATSSTLLPCRPGTGARMPGMRMGSEVALRRPSNRLDSRSVASQWKGGVPAVSSSYKKPPTMYTSDAVVATVPASALPAHTSGALHCQATTGHARAQAGGKVNSGRCVATRAKQA